VASCAESSVVAPGTLSSAGSSGESGTGATSGSGGSAGTSGSGSQSGGTGGEEPSNDAGEAGMMQAAGGSNAECASGPDCDDGDACTTDSCNVGKCYHIANAAVCETDDDECTTDVCNGGICTHPANGTCKCDGDGDCDDSNPCTDETCLDGDCDYTNNSASCEADDNDCTSDLCVSGSCSHPSTGLCECQINLDCPIDDHPCSTNACSSGQCGLEDNGVCDGSNLVVIFTNNDEKYVVLDGGFLEYTGALMAGAEIFEKVGEVGGEFKLRSLSTNLYVTLGASDNLEATASEGSASIFQTADCGSPWVSLEVQNDDDGNGFVQAGAGTRMVTNQGSCNPASETAWEKFKLIAVTGVCDDVTDCDDGNECTSELCGESGFCEFSDVVGSCTDDGNACTSDVCDSGTCVHSGNGTCAGQTVKLRTERNDKFVVVSGLSYLEYTGADLAAGALFELVDKVGDEFRLRVSGGGAFVRLDSNDELIADTDFAGSMLFSSPACGTYVALVAEGDDDANDHVKAEAGNRLKVNAGSCDPNNDGAWEKWEIVASP
jgi:hypothetical protein